MSRTSRALAALAALSLALTGCTAKKADTTTPSNNLPAAEQVLTEAALAMAGVKTTHFAINVDGKISGLRLHSAEGDLTREGNEILARVAADQSFEGRLVLDVGVVVGVTMLALALGAATLRRRTA